MEVAKSYSQKPHPYQIKAPRLKGHIRSSSVGIHLPESNFTKSPKVALPSEKSPQNISFETEVNREFKSIAKLPIEMIVKPKANRWLFKKEEEIKSNNFKLKIRFKNYRSPKKRNQQTHTDSTEKLFEFMKNIKEKPEENNPRNLIRLFNAQEPYVGRYLPTEKRTRTPLPLRPQFNNYKRTTSLASSTEDLHAKGQLNFSSVFEEKRFHIATRASLNTRELKSPEKSRNNSPSNTQYNFGQSLFQGRLEPSFPEITVKYTESVMEPEIKVTKAENAFIGKASSPLKQKLKMNMNKIILSEIVYNQSQETNPDNYENSKVLHIKNLNQTSALGFSISPEKSKQPRATSVTRSYRQSSPPSTSISPEKTKASQTRCKDHLGGGFSASQSDILEQKNSLLAKIDSSQFILPGNACSKVFRKVSIE